MCQADAQTAVILKKKMVAINSSGRGGVGGGPAWCRGQICQTRQIVPGGPGNVCLA